MKNKIKFIIVFLFIIFWINNSFASVENANFLAREKIIVDNSQNVANYRLYDNILRQETAVVALWMQKWEKKSNCNWVFADVSSYKPNDWACYTIEALAEKSIVSSSNKYFRPEDFITKSEVLWMLIKASFNNEYVFDEKNVYTKWNWQKQIVDFAVWKWIIKFFKDYDALATRDFVFDVWANILKYKNGTLKHSDVEVFATNFNISTKEAKNIILKKTWLKEDQISWLEINTEFRNSISCYKVEFFVLWSWLKLFYYINTSTWEIVDYDINFN